MSKNTHQHVEDAIDAEDFCSEHLFEYVRTYFPVVIAIVKMYRNNLKHTGHPLKAIHKGALTLCIASLEEMLSTLPVSDAEQAHLDNMGDICEPDIDNYDDIRGV